MEPPITVARTPIDRATEVSRALGCDVFVKRDDLTHPRYGGNKPRKLAHLLADAQAQGATDLVTAGAVGSHHVLATAVHGRAAGFAVHAVVVPQPHSRHVEEIARADLAQGATLIPVPSGALMPLELARTVATLRVRGQKPYLIWVGGSTPLGTLGYLDAMRELGDQITRRELDGWPNGIVCALGSGGTLAGLAAGTRLLDVPSRLVGVRVVEPWLTSRRFVAWLANRALKEAMVKPPHVGAHDFQIEDSQLGDGYGHPTAAGQAATELFARDGIILDPTYTAKAAAGLMAEARRRPGHWLFWHTLSSAAPGLLCEGTTEPLPPAICALMKTAGGGG